MAISHSVCHVTTRARLARTGGPALYSTFIEVAMSSKRRKTLLFYEKVKQRKLPSGTRIVLYNVECQLLVLNNYQVLMLIIWREKKLSGQTCTYFQCVFYFNTYVCYQNPSNKNKYNVELRFYSFVTCLTQFFIMYFNQVCMH